MKNPYTKSELGKKFRKGLLVASVMGALFTAENLNAQAYCPSAANNTYDDEIFNVTLGSLNNTSSCNTVGGPGSILQRYTNFTAPTVAAVNLTQGANYPLSVTVGQCNNYSYSGYVGVWIDYNQNGSFTDAGEQVYLSGSNFWPVGGVVITAAGGITVPAGAYPGPTRMRVIASEYNIPTPCGTYGYGETEDYSVNIVASSNCNNTPAATSVVGPVAQICPNTSAYLNLAAPYLLGNVTYTWMVSNTFSVGPYTAIPSATNMGYNTPNLNANAWYQLVAQCAGFGTTVAATPVQVQVAATTTNNVPYFEGFENGAKSGVNELPNCSWTRSNNGNCKTSTVTAFSNRTPNTGVGFANFDYNNVYTSNVYNFYSNGIQLNAGVTYSAWVYYITPGWTAYTNFKLQYGPNQSQTGIINLGTVAAPSNNTYKSLSNTFQVATSGIYYLNIQAQDNFSGSYFTFDDLGVIAPCSFTNNAANMSINGPVAICSGQSANIVATGVSSYSWNTGPTTSSIQVSPLNNSVYTVVGTNTLSNCSATLSAPLIVNPLPGVQIYAPQTSICDGESVMLFASGSATSYTWSNGPTTPLSTVQSNGPGVFTYSVIGANSYGCSSVATQVLNVNPLPTINVTGSTNICIGEAGTMTASGGTSYQWSAPTAFLQTNPVSPYPTVNTSYTVTGKDVNGCQGQTIVNMVVNACTGIANISGNIEGLQVYPNPNNGEFTVQLNNGLSKTIEVFDITGRSIVSNTSSNNEIKMNISTLSNGVYYVKVKSDNAVEVLKIVKQ